MDEDEFGEGKLSDLDEDEIEEKLIFNYTFWNFHPFFCIFNSIR